MSPNDKSYVHLSDVVSQDKRTFIITGIVLYVNASQGQTIGYDITYDPSVCPAGGGVLVPIPTSEILKKIDPVNLNMRIIR